MQKNIDRAYDYISRDIWMSAQCLETSSGEARFEFNRNSLSYVCLKGCVYMQHKSLSSYTDILINTLRDDYNIPVTVTSMDSSMDIGEFTGDDLKELKAEMTAEAREKARELRTSMECCTLLSDARAAMLSEKRLAGTERISDVEQQRLWVYFMVVKRYRIPLGSSAFVEGRPRLLDEAFVEDYVSSYAPKTLSEAATKQFYKLKRLDHVAKYSLPELEAAYCEKLESIRKKAKEMNAASPAAGRGGGASPRNIKKLEEILKKGGADMEVHQTKAHQFYPPAMKMRKLLDRMDPEWADKLNAGTDGLKLAMEVITRSMVDWLSEDITDEEYIDLMNRLGIEYRPVNAYRYLYPL